jgi:prolyl oligopeptidase
LGVAVAACAPASVLPAPAATPTSADADPYAWLESIEGARSLDWVRAQNARTDAALRSVPEFDSLLDAARAALDAAERLPTLRQRGDWFYELHRDAEHPRGVYRRIAAADLARLGDPNVWRALVDVDALAAAEGPAWAWQGVTCLPPEHARCMVELAPGGSDAAELREYDVASGAWVEGGFHAAVARSRVAWVDRNELLIATDFGPGTVSAAGYPLTVKRWRRGTPLSAAATVFTASDRAYSVHAERHELATETVTLVVEAADFWTDRYYELRGATLHRLALPDGARVRGAVADGLLVWLARELPTAERVLPEGSLVYASLTSLRADSPAFELVAAPGQRSTVEEVAVAGAGVLVTMLDDIRGRLDRVTRSPDGRWRATTLALPSDGSLAIVSAQHDSDAVLVSYEDYLTPPSLYLIRGDGPPELLAQQPPTFPVAGLVATRHIATSADGTRVPYTVIARANLSLNGSHPTMLFAYGGFRNSIVPSYSGSYEPHNGAYGSLWLSRGGVYAVANIRGGGEYGPAWHRAALRERRPRSFEDLEAVATDLVHRGVTSPQHLGIEGRSNGGLLVGAVMTRHPELVGAVVCGVPLLDLRRYHTLLAGASWMAEYGDPDDPRDWAYLATFSPYHNLRDNTSYPPILLYTSTRDDRVHPGHARKMAAALLARGAAVYYYENLEGGHAGASTHAQVAYRLALQYAFLWRALGTGERRGAVAPDPRSGPPTPAPGSRGSNNEPQGNRKVIRDVLGPASPGGQ